MIGCQGRKLTLGWPWQRTWSILFCFTRNFVLMGVDRTQTATGKEVELMLASAIHCWWVMCGQKCHWGFESFPSPVVSVCLFLFCFLFSHSDILKMRADLTVTVCTVPGVVKNRHNLSRWAWNMNGIWKVDLEISWWAQFCHGDTSAEHG